MRFCKPWWEHWFRLNTYTRPLLWSYQRVTRGWADCDTWSMDDHLAAWLPDALEYLRENTHGHPVGSSVEKWDHILEQMAEGFRAYRRRHDIDATDEDEKQYKAGMKLFVKYFNNLWD